MDKKISKSISMGEKRANILIECRNKLREIGCTNKEIIDSFQLAYLLYEQVYNESEVK